MAFNPQGREAERLAEPAAEWLAAHGPEIGARTPNTTERGRAAGIHELCQGLLAHGLTTVALFEPAAQEALYQASHGLPRRINRIAHYALSAAALAKSRLVTAEHLQCAVEEVQ